MKIFAIIIARGGSVEIPKKNICEVNGQPLISYTIKQCFESGIEEVYTSSDDDEILEIASSYGSKIIKRPTDISKNASTSEQAWIHAIKNIGNIDKKKQQSRKEISERTILNRWGEPDEVCGTVNFLLSDASRYITGTTIHVDGGWSSKGL